MHREIKLKHKTLIRKIGNPMNICQDTIKTNKKKYVIKMWIGFSWQKTVSNCGFSLPR